MKFLAVTGLLLLAILPIHGQDAFEWDIDTIFDEPLPQVPAEEQTGTDSTVLHLIRQRGLIFDLGFEFNAGLGPGWRQRPWDSDWDPNEYFVNRYIKLRNSLTLDARISDSFRVISTVNFEIPNVRFILGDFFFDYMIQEAVFLRGGKYEHSWGFSPNYGFTNLLARVPRDRNAGEAFAFKADIPISNGSFQVLTLTRADLGDVPGIRDFGFGIKYNFALRPGDFDAGIFYQYGMALRSFFSARATLGSTELYNEYLLAVDVTNPSNTSGALNIGFGHSFFNSRFRVNGELLYNAEKDTYWYHPETSIREAGISPFIEGLNFALNMQYRLWERWNPRIALSTLYAPVQHSIQLIPGIRLSPGSHVDISLAVPMALGRKNGYYYEHTFIRATVRENGSLTDSLPFAVVFLVTLRGSVSAAVFN